jgi:hypothetical protein
LVAKGNEQIENVTEKDVRGTTGFNEINQNNFIKN